MGEPLHNLACQAAKGNRLAVRQLVELIQGRVFGLCCRMLRQHQDAEDVMQEALVRIVRNLHQWDSNRPFVPWMLAIAANRCRTLLAKKAKQIIPTSLLEEPQCKSDDFQAARHLAEELDLAISHIRLEYRQAFHLFHEQQLSYIEISEALDRPLGTIKTWVHRARREIIEQLQKRDVFKETGYALRRI